MPADAPRWQLAVRSQLCILGKSQALRLAGTEVIHLIQVQRTFLSERHPPSVSASNRFLCRLNPPFFRRFLFAVSSPVRVGSLFLLLLPTRKPFIFVWLIFKGNFKKCLFLVLENKMQTFWDYVYHKTNLPWKKAKINKEAVISARLQVSYIYIYIHVTIILHLLSYLK